eukprot:CAMPEP_0179051760 /NCGR_PEP_ID=MMETSP0796-20121207/21409_1 /TAXON_ID=73915 /ORGANISM="Pyrodinium bahamense, Strain pbaha01" /LENGTH=456 /DNA_ID=CAMNT_0020748307 /DNA_START=65 /DNA_END=1436 /DNA_ORIENTATION=-
MPVITGAAEVPGPLGGRRTSRESDVTDAEDEEQEAAGAESNSGGSPLLSVGIGGEASPAAGAAVVAGTLLSALFLGLRPLRSGVVTGPVVTSALHGHGEVGLDVQGKYAEGYGYVDPSTEAGGASYVDPSQDAAGAGASWVDPSQHAPAPASTGNSYADPSDQTGSDMGGGPTTLPPFIYPPSPPESPPVYTPTMNQGSPSLYCYALTMSTGGETKLLRYQLQMRVGIFLCNEYTVYSDTSFPVGPDAAKGGAQLMAHPIGGSLKVPHGGRWGTALNTDVFVRLWKTVQQDGRWQIHDWSVKLDADAVFLPERLRALLRQFPNPGPKYMNNCKWGMHGPIEVVSRAGMNVFLNQIDTCEQIRQDAMVWQPVHWNEQMLRWTGTDKDHSFGEDQYFRRCARLLHITVVDEFRLLDELACGGNPKHTGCMGQYVSYHPFKEVDLYRSCLHWAQSLDQR